jgi:predicted alpha/beta hydrolase family esterase
MKASEAEILIVPGYTNSGAQHWQTRWQERLKTARRVEQADWSKPVLEDWTEAIVEATKQASRPVVLVAHSLGAAAVVQAAPQLGEAVAGAFLVAPPDVANPAIRSKHLMSFGPYSRDPLPFPAVVVASRNDPYCDFEIADDHAAAWGARLVDAGESGHVNEESGHGPWPEGLMVFAQFMARLRNPA